MARVYGGRIFHARTHYRRLGFHEGDGLALHVGSHERAVGVVVFQEGDEGGRYGYDLLGRDVHVLDVAGVFQQEFMFVAHGDALAQEAAVLVQGGGGLGDVVVVFLVRAQVVDFGGGYGFDGQGGDGFREFGQADGQVFVDAVALFAQQFARFRMLYVSIQDVAHAFFGVVVHRVDDFAVGGFDEAEVIDAGVGGQGADEADVGAFWGLDGADAAIVGVMDVAHFEARALAAQATGP